MRDYDLEGVELESDEHRAVEIRRSEEMEATVNLYDGLGYKVNPTGALSKKPVLEGWTQIDLDPTDFGKYWRKDFGCAVHNVGIKTDGLVVVDLDKVQVECDFKHTIVPELRKTHMSKDVLLVTHAMFLSMTNRGDIASDFRVIIDEGLKAFEDIEINNVRMRYIQDFCRMAGNKASSSFLAHIDKMINDTNDGSAVVDRQATGYCKPLIMLCMKKMQADVEKSEAFEHYENVLSVLRFIWISRVNSKGSLFAKLSKL